MFVLMIQVGKRFFLSYHDRPHFFLFIYFFCFVSFFFSVSFPFFQGGL